MATFGEKFVITLPPFRAVNDAELLAAITAKALEPSFTEIPLYNLFTACLFHIIILPEIIKPHQISPQTIIESDQLGRVDIRAWCLVYGDGARDAIFSRVT